MEAMDLRLDSHRARARELARGAAEKHYEDAVGDAEGDAPDIVSVSVDKPENEDTIRFDIEFAPERPFGSDMQTWTDVVFVAMSATAETDERGVLSSDVYTTGTHGATLARQAETGAFLVTDDEMYRYVVDVDVAGPVISFTFDRKLLDFYPIDLYWQVLVGVSDRSQSGTKATSTRNSTNRRRTTATASRTTGRTRGGRGRGYAPSRACSLAQVSLSVTVRSKTGWPGVESGSAQK